jgi:hypothetical protein
MILIKNPNSIWVRIWKSASLKCEQLKMNTVLAVRQAESQPRNAFHKSGSTASVIENASDHKSIRPPRIPLVAPSSGNRSTADSEEDWILHDAASTSNLAPRPSVSPSPQNRGSSRTEPASSLSPGGPSRRINRYDGLSANTSSRLKLIMRAGTRKHKQTVVVRPYTTIEREQLSREQLSSIQYKCSTRLL